MAALEKIRTSLVGRALIVGVDRLDHSKGLEERFLGYERLLADHPEVRSQEVLFQIVPPSRAGVASYQRIRASLEQQAGHITGVYRASRLCLVTPLRDGMNLVAKEYVAAQDPDDPGVLILSRFAGAAEQMKDAILISPYGAEEMADARKRALDMPLVKRRARWRGMMDQLRDQNVFWWLKTFHEALSASPRFVM